MIQYSQLLISIDLLNVLASCKYTPKEYKIKLQEGQTKALLHTINDFEFCFYFCFCLPVNLRSAVLPS